MSTKDTYYAVLINESSPALFLAQTDLPLLQFYVYC